MNPERVFYENRFVGIIHENKGKWYATIPLRKNMNLPTFRTCGNGVVRKPAALNHCSDAITWNSKDDVILFLKNTDFVLRRLEELLP